MAAGAQKKLAFAVIHIDSCLSQQAEAVFTQSALGLNSNSNHIADNKKRLAPMKEASLYKYLMFRYSQSAYLPIRAAMMAMNMK